MIGTRLTSLLLEKGYSVFHLGRKKRTGEVGTFVWDPSRMEIDTRAVRDVDVIIHLAGAGIADERWNERRKREILISRTEPTRLLCDTLSKIEHRVGAFISASGIGYYGLEEKNTPFQESDPPAGDYAARVTLAWEQGADEAKKQGLRVVKLRTGLVLSAQGGALKKLAAPVKFMVGAPLGSGRQIVNWIHVDDVCNIYIKAIEDVSMNGVYNAVAPQPVTNKELTEEIAKVLKRPLWLPPVPGFIVRIIAGEVAQLVLNGGEVSCAKIQRAGYVFQFPDIRLALMDLLRKRSA